jgi:hypothetical protein
MKRSLEATITVFAGVFLVLVVLPGIYSTAMGYTVWFFKISSPVITVDGKQTKGWLHKARDGRVLFFTRKDADRPETYDLVFTDSGNAYVLSCGTWTAPRLPVLPVGDVNPPCFFKGSAGQNLTRGPNSVAFISIDGKRLEARW